MGSFPVRDYINSYNQLSRTAAQKLGMKIPDPVTKDPVSAGIEGAIGGGLAAASAIGAIGGGGAGGAIGSAGPGIKTPAPGLMQKPMNQPEVATPSNAVTGTSPGWYDRFFGFFGKAQG